MSGSSATHSYPVRLTLREVRSLVRTAVREWAGSIPTKPDISRDVMSPDASTRDELRAIKDSGLDIDDGLPNHLLDLESGDDPDVFGPVPPDAPDPYVELDPYTTDVWPEPLPRFAFR